MRWALNLEIAKNRTKQAVGPLGRVGSNPTPGAFALTSPLGRMDDVFAGLILEELQAV